MGNTVTVKRNELQYMYDILSTFCSYYDECCDCPVKDCDEEQIITSGCPVKILEKMLKE